MVYRLGLLSPLLALIAVMLLYNLLLPGSWRVTVRSMGHRLLAVVEHLAGDGVGSLGGSAVGAL